MRSVNQAGASLAQPLDCPVCGGQVFDTWREAFDDRYGHPGAFNLERCRSCGHLMTSPLLSESDLPHLYGTYYPRKNLSPDTVARQAVGVASVPSRWMRWIMGTDNQGQYGVRPGEKMLDVGCGSGLSLLEAQALGAQAWGIEADPNVQRIAGALGLRVHQGSLHDAPFPGLSFDLIVMNQVIEHIPQPDQTLRLVRTRLAPGGRVVLVFPHVGSFWCRVSGARWINWHIPYHLHHFSRAAFARMAQRCGYQVTSSRTVTPNVWTLLQMRAWRQVPERGRPAALWATAAEASGGAAAAAGWRRLSRRLLLVALLPAIVAFNRILDGLGMGDSMVVELRPLESP